MLVPKIHYTYIYAAKRHLALTNYLQKLAITYRVGQKKITEVIIYLEKANKR